jgi:hypothetical protein
MKPCFLITAYCDTDTKLESLYDTLLQISSHNVDIIIYSHYPLPTYIVDKVKFAIYDKSNPVITDISNRCMVYWHKILNSPYKITQQIPDYGFAAIQQWKRGINFINNLGYDRVYLINYDTKFSSEFFLKSQKHLDENQCFAIEYGESSLYLAYFAFNLSTDFVNTINFIDFSHYINNVEDSIVENYMFQLLHPYISHMHKISDFNNEDITTNIVIAQSDVIDLLDAASVTAGLEKFVFGEKTPNYDKLIVIFFKISKDIHFIVNYDSNKILETFIDSNMGYSYVQLPLHKSWVDYDKLNFIVNGIENTKLIKYCKELTIETLLQ